MVEVDASSVESEPSFLNAPPRMGAYILDSCCSWFVPLWLNALLVCFIIYIVVTACLNVLSELDILGFDLFNMSTRI